MSPATPDSARLSAPQLLDDAALGRTLVRLAHEVCERHGEDADPPVLVGIRTRGVPLAQRLARLVAALGRPIPSVAALDLTDFRDDRPRVEPRSGGLSAVEPDTIVPTIQGRLVILVDDVVQTGRSLRAAIDAVLFEGRPSSLELLVLVDRGHREFPLRATYVGKNVSTASSERVQVKLREIDGIEGAWITVPEAEA